MEAGRTPTQALPTLVDDNRNAVERDLRFLSHSPHGAADAYLELCRLRTGFHDRLGAALGSAGLAGILLGSVGLFVSPLSLVFAFVGFGLLVVHTRSESTGGRLGGLSSPRLSDRLVQHLDTWVAKHPEALHLRDDALRAALSDEVAAFAARTLSGQSPR